MGAEQSNVDFVVAQLRAMRRWHTNLHGTIFSSRNGEPDIVTCDGDGRLLAIEVKSNRGRLYINQIRRAREIVLSGGRYVVAFSDFDIRRVDSHDLDVLDVGEFDCADDGSMPRLPHKTFEFDCY